MRAAIDILIGNICHIRVTSVSFIEETWYLDIGMTSVQILYTLNIKSYQRSKGLFTVFALVHLKNKLNDVYDHFIYWQPILQLSFPSFPLDNLHNVQ